MTRNEQIEAGILQRQAARLVEREVLVCLSSMVSTLASGGVAIEQTERSFGRDERKAMASLCEQALELASPIPDYEEAAREAGWRGEPGAFIDDRESVIAEEGEARTSVADSWDALCNEEGIEPYDRDVFEHWAVSSWLAEKLIAKGERVDRDFAGLNVWARTTTGQAISIDSVIEAITKETGYASRPATDAA